MSNIGVKLDRTNELLARIVDRLAQLDERPIEDEPEPNEVMGPDRAIFPLLKTGLLELPKRRGRPPKVKI